MKIRSRINNKNDLKNSGYIYYGIAPSHGNIECNKTTT